MLMKERCLITPSMIRREVQRLYPVEVVPTVDGAGYMVGFGERLIFVPMGDLALSLDEFSAKYLKDGRTQ